MKIKNVIFLTVIVPLSLLSAKPAVAINNNPTARMEREETREQIREEREELKEDRQEIRTTIVAQKKTMWTEMKRRQVQAIVNRIQKELEMRYSIVLKLKNKIGERIEKKSITHDTALASAKLALFSDAQYQTEMTALKAKMAEITASETPRDLLPGVRESANRVRVQLRAMHQFLVEVMKLVATAPRK